MSESGGLVNVTSPAPLGSLPVQSVPVTAVTV
jgi:hypothetical protein